MEEADILAAVGWIDPLVDEILRVKNFTTAVTDRVLEDEIRKFVGE